MIGHLPVGFAVSISLRLLLFIPLCKKKLWHVKWLRDDEKERVH